MESQKKKEHLADREINGPKYRVAQFIKALDGYNKIIIENLPPAVKNTMAPNAPVLQGIVFEL